MSLRFRFAPRVGYMNGSLNEGNTLLGPVFSAVGQQDAENGTGTINLGSIVPVGDNVPNGYTPAAGVDAITAQILDANGGAVSGSLVYWRDSKGEKWGGKSKQEYKGWYVPNGKTPADFSITAGQALWVNIPAGFSCTLQSSGEVAIGDIYMQLNKGNTAVCNPIPVETNIQKILPFGIGGTEVPNGFTPAAGVDAITAQKLDPNGGAVSGSLVYWRDSKGEKWGGKSKQEYKGWYIPNGKTPADITVGPGEGLWVNSPVATTALVFPSAWEKNAE